MPRTFPTIVVVLAALFGSAAAACGRQAQAPEATASRTHVYLFIDQSASLSGQQGEQWSKAFEGAANRLKPGDAITVFGMHDHTADAAALYSGATERTPPGAGMTRQMRDADALTAMKAKAIDAVNAALSSPRRASWTDILSALDRIEPDPGRRTLAILLTDALHSMPELDFERARLTRDSFRVVIEQVAKSHAWSNESLRNVDVAFVLNGLEMGARGAAVDRRTLRAFYDALVQTLGGRLVGFDTELAWEKRS